MLLLNYVMSRQGKPAPVRGNGEPLAVVQPFSARGVLPTDEDVVLRHRDRNSAYGRIRSQRTMRLSNVALG